MVFDFMSYFIDDILMKVDWVVMVVSFEICVLMFDYWVIEYVWSFLFFLKFWDGCGKWVFCEVFDKYVFR